MKKTLIAFSLLASIVACSSETAKPVASAPLVLAAKESLDTFALSIMDFDKCKGGNSMSPARRKLLSKQIARILEELGGHRDAQETFILLMCIESRFRPDAKSQVGAQGIAQVMFETGKAVAKDIGLGDITKEDLLDPELNIRIGYSYFLGLVKEMNGNFAKAAAGYNSGPRSPSVKAMGYLGQGHPETGWYVGNLYNLKEELRIAEATIPKS